MQIPTPPDRPKEQSGTLSTLSIQGVGPAKKLDLHLAERINLLTGDNGLGKSFVLECAWWVLSGNWSGFPAYPRTDADKNEPKIQFSLTGKMENKTKASLNIIGKNRNGPYPNGTTIDMLLLGSTSEKQ